MNTGNVKRTIEIADLGEDVFSDDIKTSALIEEIEAAEVAARLAKVEEQIDASQPTAWQKLTGKVAGRVEKVKTAANEKIADLKTKVPEEPKVKKVTLAQRLSEIKVKRDERSAAKKAAKLAKRQIAQVEKIAKRQAALAEKERRKLNLKQALAAGAAKVNALAPEGIARKRVVEYCVAGMLVVTAAELWAWNFTHPLFQNQNQVEKVPITGVVEPVAEEDDDSPFDTPVTEAENTAEEVVENTEDANAAAETNDNSSNYYYAQPAAANNNSGASAAASSPASSSKKTTSNTSQKQATSSSSTKNTSKTSDKVTEDSQWDDKYANMEPATDEGAVDEDETGGGSATE